MTKLEEEQCVPCRGGDKPLDESEAAPLLEQLPGWEISGAHTEPRLTKVFEFEDFAGALAFTNKVGEAAEAANHHPALLTEYGKVTVSWWTHAIGGLHRNDFVMAARTEALNG